MKKFLKAVSEESNQPANQTNRWTHKTYSLGGGQLHGFSIKDLTHLTLGAGSRDAPGRGIPVLERAVGIPPPTTLLC